MAIHDLSAFGEHTNHVNYTPGGTSINPASPPDPSAWEMYAILDMLHELEGASRDAVLVTAVQSLGASYRHPGARMLLVRDGRRVGCVVAPHLESDLAKQAWWMTESRVPVVRSFGPTVALLERTDTPEFSRMAEFLEKRRKLRKPTVIATVISAGNLPTLRIGDRLLLDESWARCGVLAGSPLETQVLTHASAALREKKSRLVRLGMADLFVEWAGPPISVTVLGAGRDTAPLVRFAKLLGWDVSLVDCGGGGDPLSGLNIGADSAVVLMTHNYALDAALLRQIMPLKPSYLGVLGSKARAEKLFAEIDMSPGPNVHAPAGLDIGGDTPDLIALSIVSEIQARMSHRAGGMLKRRAAALHTATPEKGLSGEEASAALSHAR
jgi:xanthine dehydrogenase accessory factor